MGKNRNQKIKLCLVVLPRLDKTNENTTMRKCISQSLRAKSRTLKNSKSKEKKTKRKIYSR